MAPLLGATALLFMFFGLWGTSPSSSLEAQVAAHEIRAFGDAHVITNDIPDQPVVGIHAHRRAILGRRAVHRVPSATAAMLQEATNLVGTLLELLAHAQIILGHSFGFLTQALLLPLRSINDPFEGPLHFVHRHRLEESRSVTHGVLVLVDLKSF